MLEKQGRKRIELVAREIWVRDGDQMGANVNMYISFLGPCHIYDLNLGTVDLGCHGIGMMGSSPTKIDLFEIKDKLSIARKKRTCLRTMFEISTIAFRGLDTSGAHQS